jgi:S-DNA-T family DNA segregation ATPase FtsK/SpoIIIE
VDQFPAGGEIVKSLKMTLHRAGGPGGGERREFADIRVSADATTTVRDLAEALAERDPVPTRHPMTVTLAVEEEHGVRTLPATALVDKAGLRNGAVVRLVDAGSVSPGRVDQIVGVLDVLEGPDTGRRIQLRPGVNTVGRAADCDVVLTDRAVSMHHAKIEIADAVEILDTASTHGVIVGGGRVSRARLGAGDTAALGNSVIRVSTMTPAGGPDDDTRRTGHYGRSAIGFNRSPRVDPTYAGVERIAPEPPQKPSVRRFPLIPMLAPLVLGSVLYLITGSMFSLVFVALSPLMLLGSYAEDAVSNRRAFRVAVAEFRTALAQWNAALHSASDEQRGARQAEHPSTVDLVRAATNRDALLWTRRPDQVRWLEVRLGLGRQASRDRFTLPNRNQSTPQLWAELTEVSERFATIDAVPVVARITECGSLGVAGYGEHAWQVAQGLVAQLVILHSPAELVLTAITSTQSAPRWDWLKWLPHTSSYPDSPHSPLRTGHLAAAGSDATTLVAQIDDIIARRATVGPRPGADPSVILLVEDDADADRSALVSIAERGPACGVHVIWCAPAVEALPAACRTFVHVDGRTGVGSVGHVVTAEQVEPVVVEPLPTRTALDLAVRLSPVVDAGARAKDDSGLPASVSFLTLVKEPVDRSAQSVIDLWEQSGSLGGIGAASGMGKGGHLSTVVGVTGGGTDLTLDLRTHGPHALVGGTTGAGKSEFLQSWIVGLAARYSPRRVAFLLVDYKGGSAFGACDQLPHSVGLFTDLRPRLVDRALISLRAELRNREEVLNLFRAKDLAELEAKDEPGIPPRLVIVVDEFAALKREVPEFVDGVVDVAARGRSLGLHLILATQRPANVITDNLRANTNLRVALRMADATDSVDVLGSPVAASFDPAVPGRAAAKSGPGRLDTFQAAYVGGWTPRDAPAPTISIETLQFGSGDVWAVPQRAVPAGAPVDSGVNDIARVVETIRAAFVRTNLDLPDRPWLDELPAVIELRSLVHEASLRTTAGRRTAAGGAADGPVGPALVFGRQDVPLEQAQPPVAFYPDSAGNLVVFGTGGSGKSTLLRTLAASAAMGGIGPCHVYGLDFASGGLDVLTTLPQVGAVIQGEDTARVERLLRMVRDLIDQRKRLVPHARGIADFWTSRGSGLDSADWKHPRVLILLDGVGAFQQKYPPGGLAGVYETLLTVATEGRRFGVHLVVSADRAGAMPSSLLSSMQCRVVLRLANDNDYRLIGVAPDAIDVEAPPGRGRLNTWEIQVAVLGGADQVDEHRAIERLAQDCVGVPPGPAVGTLPEQVRLRELPETDQRGEPVLGIADDTLGPVGFPPRGPFMVTGPAGSARTAALLTVVESVRRWRPRARFLYVGAAHSALASWDGWSASATSPAAVNELARSALPAVGPASTDGLGEGLLVVVIEGLPDYARTTIDDPLYQLVKACGNHQHLVVFEGDVSQMALSSALHQFVRSGRTGLILQPQTMDGQVLNSTLPKGLRQDEFPPDRGLIVVHGQSTVVQVALSG